MNNIELMMNALTKDEFVRFIANTINMNTKACASGMLFSSDNLPELALATAFKWKDSPEGAGYWEDIFFRISNKDSVIKMETYIDNRKK